MDRTLFDNESVAYTGGSRGPVTSLELSTADGLLAGRFPKSLVAEVNTASGARLQLRPIRSDDAEKLVAFHSQLSVDTIYRRYFSVHPALSCDEVRHFTQVDYVDRLALVIENGRELVAVGRYDRCDGTTTAEVAFVVRDDYQHLGFGHRLLSSLAEAAWDRGITHFSAETLATNHDMLSVFRHSRFPVTTTSESNEVSVRFSIDPT